MIYFMSFFFYINGNIVIYVLKEYLSVLIKYEKMICIILVLLF